MTLPKEPLPSVAPSMYCPMRFTPAPLILQLVRRKTDEGEPDRDRRGEKEKRQRKRDTSEPESERDETETETGGSTDKKRQTDEQREEQASDRKQRPREGSEV